MQHCPALKKSDIVDWDNAASRLAFLVMIFADFPPNYNVTLFKLFTCEFLMISYPTSDDPVKATLSIPEWRAKWAPISPYPETILTTPSGMPAYLNNSASLKAERGVCSAVFMIVVHPAAKTGANFHANINIGKFQGMICPTTPTGYFLVYVLKGPSAWINWP